MLCQPPLHNKMNQPYTYRYASLLDFPPIQVTTVHQVRSLCYTACSHQLSVLYIVSIIEHVYFVASKEFVQFSPWRFCIPVSIFTGTILQKNSHSNNNNSTSNSSVYCLQGAKHRAKHLNALSHLILTTRQRLCHQPHFTFEVLKV